MRKIEDLEKSISLLANYYRDDLVIIHNLLKDKPLKDIILLKIKNLDIFIKSEEGIQNKS